MSNSRTSFLSETYIESLSRFGVGFFFLHEFYPRGLAAREISRHAPARMRFLIRKHIY